MSHQCLAQTFHASMSVHLMRFVALLYEMLLSGWWKPTTSMGLKKVGVCLTCRNVPDLRKLYAEPQACSRDKKPLWFTEMLLSNVSAP